MEQNAKKEKYTSLLLKMLIAIVVSFIDTVAISYVLKLDNTVLFSNSIVSFLLFLGLTVYVFRNIKQLFASSIVLGILISLFQILSLCLNREINTFIVIVIALSLAYTYALIINSAFSFLDDYQKKNISIDGFASLKKIYGKYGILFGFFLMLTTQIIIWLAVYPGYFCYDATWQLNMFETGSITQHHPVLHTIILGGCVNGLYRLLGNYNKAIAIYLFCQMVLNTAIVSYSLHILKKQGIRNRYIFWAQIWYAFFPSIALLMQCSTKDSIFSTIFLLAIALLYSLEKGGNNHKFVQWIKLTVCFALCVLLRNNIVYVFVLLSLMLIILRKRVTRKFKELIIIFIICILISITTNTIFTKVGFAKGPFREAFSVPIQQIAMVYNLNYEDLKTEELVFLEELNSPDRWKEFDPHLTDELRWGVDDEMLKNEFPKFIRIWFSIGIRNIKMYTKAFLTLTQYAWDTSSIIDVYKNNPYYEYDTTQKSYFMAWTETPGVRNSKIPFLESFFWKISRFISFEKIPVLSMLFSVAFMNWFMMFAFAYAIHSKKRNWYCSYIILIIMISSLLFGPTVLPRYYLPVFMVFPLFIFSLLQCEEKRTEEYETK